MTITEAIDRADSLKPNQYTPEMKRMWLSELDAMIYNDLMLRHEDNPLENSIIEETEDGEVVYKTPEMLKPYENESVELLAPFPYDAIYPAYIRVKIDEYNEETARYANSATMFNSLYDNYAKWYNRTHMPKGVKPNNAFPRHY